MGGQRTGLSCVCPNGNNVPAGQTCSDEYASGRADCALRGFGGGLALGNGAGCDGLVEVVLACKVTVPGADGCTLRNRPLL